MKKILVIEDQPDMRDNLHTILRMEGYEVATADDGAAGLRLARQARPDVIICDVMMPEMDGYEVLRQLRRHPPTADVPFIFLTAKGEKKDQRAGMNLGADDYLTKPVTSTDLLTTVAARLARQEFRAPGEFRPDFSSARPLESLGLTPREAEVLLWVAQGKTNPDIASILGAAESTVKKHVQNIFEKLGVESRNAAMLRALEFLSSLSSTEG